MIAESRGVYAAAFSFPLEYGIGWGRMCVMSEDSPEKNQQSLEEQLREMMRKASFMFVSPESSPAAGPAGSDPDQGEQPDRLKPIREFDLKPRDVRDYLSRFVVKQEEAQKVLSVAVCDHYNHVRRCLEDPESEKRDYAKHNILLLGPTGVGKTYLIRCAARLIGVPFVKADATKFSETGYVGHDVEDLVRDLVKAADGDVDIAQYGIIFLDEIDKIASKTTSGGKDVSGRGVQINLLKLMEETDVSLFSQTDIIGQMQAVMDMQRGRDVGKRTISTRHILFVVSGAFTELAEQVRKRVSASRIGFSLDSDREHTETEYLRLAGTKDFIDYGFEPEFIGRLPVRVVCDALNVDDLEAIMNKTEGNILEQYVSDFEGYGIGLRIAPDAASAIARLAYREETGARGLMTVLEHVFRDYKFELPSTGIRTLDAGQSTIERPGETLAGLLERKDSLREAAMRSEVKAFAQRFQNEYGLKLVFEKKSADLIIKRCMEQDKSVRAWIEERFHDFEYGLRLISRNTGRTTFTITKKLVENPEEELSRRIALSFKTGRSSKE